MNRSTTFSLSKIIILLAVTLFSATTFAATCPEIKDIHDNGQGYWATDSGYVSSTPIISNEKGVNYPKRFMLAEINSASIQDNQIVGNIACTYDTNIVDIHKLSLSMVRPQTSTFIDKNDPNWIKSVFPGLPNGTATCLSMQDDLSSCNFTLVSNVTNPFSTNP